MLTDFACLYTYEFWLSLWKILLLLLFSTNLLVLKGSCWKNGGSLQSFWWIVYLIHHEQHKQQMSIMIPVIPLGNIHCISLFSSFELKYLFFFLFVVLEQECSLGATVIRATNTSTQLLLQIGHKQMFLVWLNDILLVCKSYLVSQLPVTKQTFSILQNPFCLCDLPVHTLFSVSLIIICVISFYSGLVENIGNITILLTWRKILINRSINWVTIFDCVLLLKSKVWDCYGRKKPFLCQRNFSHWLP